jgi:hypothetical protein
LNIPLLPYYKIGKMPNYGEDSDKVPFPIPGMSIDVELVLPTWVSTLSLIDWVWPGSWEIVTPKWYNLPIEINCTNTWPLPMPVCLYLHHHYKQKDHLDLAVEV